MPHPDEGDEVGADEPIDTREALRQANLAEAKRVVLGTPCHDVPTPEVCDGTP